LRLEARRKQALRE